MHSRDTILIGALICAAAMANAEMEISVFGGLQGAFSYGVSIDSDSVIPDDIFDIDWDSSAASYGLRVTKWQNSSFGYGIDFTHSTGDNEDDQRPEGLDMFEFADGLNTLTFNGYYRLQDRFGEVTPYVGAGVGLAIPDVKVVADDSRTSGLQVTGPAAVIIAGASLPVSENWSVFGEYKGTYTDNRGDLDTDGNISADVFNNALNVGVTFNF